MTVRIGVGTAISLVATSVTEWAAMFVMEVIRVQRPQQQEKAEMLECVAMMEAAIA